MTGPITRHRGTESLKTAARWPGADRATAVIHAIRLAAARADAEGYRNFCELAGAQKGEAERKPGLGAAPADTSSFLFLAATEGDTQTAPSATVEDGPAHQITW